MDALLLILEKEQSGDKMVFRGCEMNIWEQTGKWTGGDTKTRDRIMEREGGDGKKGESDGKEDEKKGG